MSHFIETWLAEFSVLSMLLLTIVVYSDVKWCWGRVDNPSGQSSYWGHRNVGNLWGFHGVWSVGYVHKNLLFASMPITPCGQCKVAYYLQGHTIQTQTAKCILLIISACLFRLCFRLCCIWTLMSYLLYVYMILGNRRISVNRHDFIARLTQST